jgi:hypothetical protein
MAKDDRANGKTETKAAADMLGSFAAPGMEAVMRAGDMWIKGMGSLNEEIISFSQQQMKKAVEASQSLMQCSTLDQALAAQQDIARGTLESYYRECNKILDLTGDLARKTWAQGERASMSVGGED